ncbi:uracil/xanthine transporter [Mesobacillus foraminis]|uniref:uracil/xanthine transporter n=1 Tax=Mesobacillus foraminis TaxID=279826 RepID=UPI000EF44165|nr:uracil/xanthine transporter [Mesobacillus foraminis]
MNKWFSSVTILSSVQWLFFIFANTVVVPISVGTLFEVPPETVAFMLRTSLIITGIVCIFQGWIGHRMPLMEGPSGLLWGVILNLGMSASSLGVDLSTIGGGIATGVILASLFTLILIAFNGIKLIQSVFSPMVMTVYLFLLTFQLVFIFFKGMLKINDQGTLDVGVSLLSVGIVIFVGLLKLQKNQLVSNFSILIGLSVGWIFYELLFNRESTANSQSIENSFSFFPLGQPNLEMGIIGVTFFAVVMNLSNSIASISTGSKLLQLESTEERFRRSISVTSIFTIIGSAFGLVPYTPFTSTIGFLQSTRVYQREPFLIGGGLLAFIGLVPAFSSFLAAMPITVGNAVLFVAYLQMFGTAFSNLNGRTFNSNTIFRLAAPVLVGVSLMNVSPTMFNNLPILIQPFITNGLIMGVIISIVLEKTINWKAYEHTLLAKDAKTN